MCEKNVCECVPGRMGYWDEEHHGFGSMCCPGAFATQKEKVEVLNEYQHSLEDELKKVRERIKALGKG